MNLWTLAIISSELAGFLSTTSIPAALHSSTSLVSLYAVYPIIAFWYSNSLRFYFVAWRPSIWGMFTSIKITKKCWQQFEFIFKATFCTASIPVFAVSRENFPISVRIIFSPSWINSSSPTIKIWLQSHCFSL